MISHIRTKKVLLTDLVFDARNARKHNAKNMKAIKDSLDKFSQVEPLVVQKSTMKVIGGNGRLAAMKELGWKDCDIVELDIDNEKATALGIVLNRTAETAEWDDDTLKDILGELDNAGWDIEGLGWDSEDVDLIGSFEPNLPDESDGSQKKLQLIVSCETESDLEDLFNELRDRGLKVKL